MKIPKSNSSASLQPGSRFGAGSMRITDQVIEEVDEQSTVTSMRPPDLHPNVRTIFPSGIHHQTGPPPPSAPVAVPNTSLSSKAHLLIIPLSSSAPATAAVAPPVAVSPAPSSVTYTEVLSVKSAPGYGTERPQQANRSVSHPGSQGDCQSLVVQAEGDTISIGGSSTASSDDEFTRLKQTRDKERKEKLIQRLARSISAQQAGNIPLDNEQLLMDINIDSRTGLLSASSPRSSVFGDSNV